MYKRAEENGKKKDKKEKQRFALRASSGKKSKRQKDRVSQAIDKTKVNKRR